MSSNLIFFILVIGIIIGLIKNENLSFNLTNLIGWFVALLAVLAWLTIVLRRKKQDELDLKVPTRKSKDKETNEAPTAADNYEGEEFHNDFSKVPAGEPDPIQPMPRSIGYGYGDGGKSLDEDLERIARKIQEDKDEVKEVKEDHSEDDRSKKA